MRLPRLEPGPIYNASAADCGLARCASKFYFYACVKIPFDVRILCLALCSCFMGPKSCYMSLRHLLKLKLYVYLLSLLDMHMASQPNSEGH